MFRSMTNSSNEGISKVFDRGFTVFSFQQSPFFFRDSSLTLPRTFLPLSIFFSAASLARKSLAKRNINQASMGRTSEPASGNVRPIGLKAFSLHEMLSNGPLRRPADATLNWPSRQSHTRICIRHSSAEHRCA